MSREKETEVKSTTEEEAMEKSDKKTLPKVQQNLTKIHVEPDFLEEDIKKVEELQGKDDSDLEAEAKVSDEEGEEEEGLEEDPKVAKSSQRRMKGKKRGAQGRDEMSGVQETLITEQHSSECERLQSGEEEGNEERKGKRRKVEESQVTHSTSGKFTVVEEGSQQKQKKKTGILK